MALGICEGITLQLLSQISRNELLVTPRVTRRPPYQTE